jgi:type VI protein secretion system component VasK
MDNYPLLNLFWTMLWFFLFIAWIWLLIALLTDIFRSRDLSGWVKALWTLFIIITPLVGALVYLIARGAGMADRSAKEYQAREQAFRDYVKDAASTDQASVADELAKLAQLRDAGTISADEFETQKAKLLA